MTALVGLRLRLWLVRVLHYRDFFLDRFIRTVIYILKIVFLVILSCCNKCPDRKIFFLSSYLQQLLGILTNKRLPMMTSYIVPFNPVVVQIIHDRETIFGLTPLYVFSVIGLRSSEAEIKFFVKLAPMSGIFQKFFHTRRCDSNRCLID